MRLIYRRWILPLVLPVAFLVGWEVAARMSWLMPSASVAPSAVALRFVNLIVSGQLLNHLTYSMLRIICSVTCGSVFGVITAILVSQSVFANRMVSPGIQMIAPVPIVVWMPFLVMAFGVGEIYKIALATIITYLIVHTHTVQGIYSIERDFIELAAIYEKKLLERTQHVLIPGSMRAILTGMRLSLAFAWIAVFFVEYSSSEAGTEGLGWFVSDARQAGRIEDEFAGVLLIAITGFLIDSIVSIFQRRTLSWTKSTEK